VIEKCDREYCGENIAGRMSVPLGFSNYVLALTLSECFFDRINRVQQDLVLLAPVNLRYPSLTMLFHPGNPVTPPA